MKIAILNNYRADKALAKSLAQTLSKEISPKVMNEKRKLLSVNKITKILEIAYQSVEIYQVNKKLGFFRRVVLANNFKWELKSLNYPDDFVNMATEGLLVSLTKS